MWLARAIQTRLMRDFFLPAQNEYPKPIENIFYLNRLVKIEPCYNFHYLHLSKQQAV
jgi:hypothetical protein